MIIFENLQNFYLGRRGKSLRKYAQNADQI